MTIVNSKSDIKEALKRGETEFYTSNKTLLYASVLVAKCKSFSVLKSFIPGMNFVISEGTIIVITLAVLATAIALFAIYSGYDVDVDYKRGKIKCRRK